MKRIAAAVAAATLASAALAADGAQIFATRCTACHGKDGKGTPVGQKMGAKDLATTKLSEKELEGVIANGKGKMTAYKGKLSDEEIAAVAKYVKSGLK